MSMAEYSALSRSTPAVCISLLPIASGNSPVAVWANLATGEPCASIPTASITDSAPRPSVRSWIASTETGADFAQVDGLDTALLGAGQSLGHQIDGDDPVTEMVGDARSHVPDRAQAEHGYRPAVRNVCVCDRLPSRREHVGEIDESRIGRTLRHFDVGELSLRHPQQLGLATGDLAVEL